VATVAEHYANHLAPIYVWMAGGLEGAIARGAAEIDAVCPHPSRGYIAVDLGAGFGVHTIPLARRGYSVLAVDSSAILLELLRGQAETLPIRAVEDDLLAFPRHLDTKAHLILCMGDTLTHLSETRSVEQLFSLVAEALHPGGQFIATLRDYTSPLIGDRRFIPVRSDDDRILTCFLEYSPGYVTVHDLLHEREGSQWHLRVSAYRKLRLSADWVSSSLQSKGFVVRVEPGLAGMVRVVATSV
jgi:SAM-dependent methyltransferase